MKIKLLTATLAAMLCLTACGDANTKTSSESKADTTTTAATEEVTTEAVTEEVPTETTPAVETTVTTTTEATTTTEEIPPEPEREAFQLAPGLSEKYVDFDNLALEFNGQILRFGEATVQDFLDAGVDLSTDANLDNPKQIFDRVEAEVMSNDSFRVNMAFYEPSGTSPSSAREYVLNSCRVYLKDSFSFDITWGPNYEDGMLHFNIPRILTMEELIENSGEPIKISNGAAPNVKVCDYISHSLIRPDDSNFCSLISFTFVDDKLSSFGIKIHENNIDY